MGSSCMYNVLKVCSFWPTVNYVACLPASEKWTFSQQCCRIQKCNTLGKVFFFFELKYTGKVIWDLREKAPFPVKAKANASLPNWTPRQATSISSEELPRRDLLWIVSPSVEVESFLAFHADICAVDTAAALTDKTRLKEPDSLVFFFTQPKYHIIYAVEK